MPEMKQARKSSPDMSKTKYVSNIGQHMLRRSILDQKNQEKPGKTWFLVFSANGNRIGHMREVRPQIFSFLAHLHKKKPFFWADVARSLYDMT